MGVIKIQSRRGMSILRMAAFELQRYGLPGVTIPKQFASRTNVTIETEWTPFEGPCLHAREVLQACRIPQPGGVIVAAAKVENPVSFVELEVLENTEKKSRKRSRTAKVRVIVEEEKQCGVCGKTVVRNGRQCDHVQQLCCHTCVKRCGRCQQRLVPDFHWPLPLYCANCTQSTVSQREPTRILDNQVLNEGQSKVDDKKQDAESDRKFPKDGWFFDPNTDKIQLYVADVAVGSPKRQSSP